MKNSSRISVKTSYFHIFMLILASFSVLACSSRETPKVVTHKNNNGNDGCVVGCTSKPTPESGYMAPTYGALNFIALKQAERYLDLALFDSPALLDPCQVVSKQKISPTVDIIEVTMSETKCVFNNPLTTWRGEFEIEVNYANEKRGADAEIIKIEKKRGRFDQSIHFEQGKLTRDIEINDLVTFTLQKDKSYSFIYEGGIKTETTINMSKSRDRNTSQRSDKKGNKKDENKDKEDESEIEADNLAKPKKDRRALTITAVDATGLVIPMAKNIKNTFWKLTYSKIENKRSHSRSRYAIDAEMTLNPDNSAAAPLICGLPQGHFSFTQAVTKEPAPEQIYNPNLVVDTRGAISVINGSSKFNPTKCGLGLHDLDETVKQVETDFTRQ